MNRRKAVEELSSRMERRAYPRLEMFLILASTATVGFLSSRWMLQQGVEAMALRYPLSVFVAYVSFLALVGTWVHFRQLNLRARGRDADREGGRDFNPVDLVDFAFQGFDSLLEFELGIASFVFVVLAGWWITEAPVLLAELILEAGLAGSLYPALRTMPREGWLPFLIRKTAVSVTIVVTLFTLLGASFQRLVPKARSVGEVLEVVRPGRSIPMSRPLDVTPNLGVDALGKRP